MQTGVAAFPTLGSNILIATGRSRLYRAPASQHAAQVPVRSLVSVLIESFLSQPGITTNGASWLKVGMKPCPAGGGCLRVKYRRLHCHYASGHAPDRVNLGCWQALDPESFNVTEDIDGFGFFCVIEKGVSTNIAIFRDRSLGPIHTYIQIAVRPTRRAPSLNVDDSYSWWIVDQNE
jgi:hypothetical protein